MLGTGQAFGDIAKKGPPSRRTALTGYQHGSKKGLYLWISLMAEL
jgi:hypothetical protein